MATQYDQLNFSFYEEKLPSIMFHELKEQNRKTSGKIFAELQDIRADYEELTRQMEMLISDLDSLSAYPYKFAQRYSQKNS